MSGVLASVDQRTQLVGENRLELLLFYLHSRHLFALNVFKIKEVNWDDIIVDINHALSGKTLTFEVEIIDIK